ncbi:lysozyme [Shewanella sp. C32]|uniref:Lysozyme n=1 Tax=Shewanella electrica TaxID=515560 RepID=A0ABT2FQD5_9GAMM|nr:lysozyme [Shewanella electrica]MCH1926880.1 lysozyme [Shewanella electrica]MCS4558530.1 lysozyme [Shewanella electrica]
MRVRQFLAAMGLSAAVVTGGSMIAEQEGMVLNSYLDPVEINTVCFGHTGADIDNSKTYTLEECLRQLAADLVIFNNQLLQLTRQVRLSNEEHAAYLSFIYNIGAGAFAESTLRKKLLAGDHVGACNELPRWIYAKGKKLLGLMVRRQRERDLCLKGVNYVQHHQERRWPPTPIHHWRVNSDYCRTEYWAQVRHRCQGYCASQPQYRLG